MVFHDSILQIQEELNYHQQQQEKLEQELYKLKCYEESAAQAFDHVRETIEQIEDPKCLELFKESLLSLFPATYASQEVETDDPIYLEEAVQDQTPAPDDRRAAHEPVSIVSITTEENTNTKKPICNLLEIPSDVVYDKELKIAYCKSRNKARSDNYGYYLTKRYNIATKYKVSTKPTIVDSKYQLELYGISLQDAAHLAKFNLLKEIDDKENRELLEHWADRKIVLPPAYTPTPKPTPLDEINIGDQVHRGRPQDLYEVTGKIEKNGEWFGEVVCLQHSEFKNLEGQTFHFKEIYLVQKNDVIPF